MFLMPQSRSAVGMRAYPQVLSWRIAEMARLRMTRLGIVDGNLQIQMVIVSKLIDLKMVNAPK